MGSSFSLLAPYDEHDELVEDRANHDTMDDEDNDEHELAHNLEANDHPDWLQLPDDLIVEIVKRLDVVDRAKLSNVCKSWSRVALNKDIPVHQFPLLMLPSKIKSDHVRLFDTSRSLMYRFNLPDSVVQRGGWCFGSTKGWLLIATLEKNYTPHISLLNPVSGQIIKLPSITAFEACTNDPYSFADLLVTKMELYFLSEDDIFISAIFDDNKLAICIAGDEEWTIVSESGDHNFYDDMCFFKGTLYVLHRCSGSDGDDDRDGVVLLNSALTFQFSESSSIAIKLVSLIGGQTLGREIIEQNGFDIITNICRTAYLVESHGELLIVDRVSDGLSYDDDVQSFEYAKTKQFEIFKMVNGSASKSMCKLRNDQIVFMGGRGPCVSLSAKDFNDKVKGNCIHFLDEYDVFDFFDLPPFVSRESGICCLDDGRITRCYPTIKFPMDSRMTWLTPQLI
ncbi:uncharacterized protein LOC126681969 [Mercurialis annua]|uniref:uncharacterized protein LOC126681969 n=1 Tax=Mercurialis annua TaxID=3986 RepID=UPI00215EB6C6|nr:uncharacterized protein LOC126681969 [Mercurialis annua]